ncbi:MAG: hypothetical protein K6F73_07705 [Lachnospiraceae bacterium]|nr:hypothetical protein [Lachnospiraceae bacterium]
MSEISEFRDEMMTMFGLMGLRFDAMDQRFDAMDKRMNSMDQKMDKFSNDLEWLYKDIHENMFILHSETCERMDRIEERLSNVESACRLRWITPELSDRLSAVEMVVSEHSEQIKELKSVVFSNA